MPVHAICEADLCAENPEFAAADAVHGNPHSFLRSRKRMAEGRGIPRGGGEKRSEAVVEPFSSKGGD